MQCSGCSNIGEPNFRINIINSLIISAVGSDRPGIVSEISGVITSHGGNIEKSRMTRLGADFTIIMLVMVDSKWEESLVVTLQAIKELSISTMAGNGSAQFRNNSRSIRTNSRNN